MALLISCIRKVLVDNYVNAGQSGQDYLLIFCIKLEELTFRINYPKHKALDMKQSEHNQDLKKGIILFFL